MLDIVTRLMVERGLVLERVMVNLRKHKGQAMVEYALILALISVVAIVALGLIGTNVNLVYDNVQQRLGAAI
jgi:pilus assembly protein Flp/PilA